MMDIFILYLFIVNVVLFLMMYLDKSRAKNKSFRIKERTLFLFALAFGSVGGILGMYTFRHKTKHLSFKLGFPFILIVQLFVMYKFFM